MAPSAAPFVRVAMLADYAQAQPNGRFQIVGGGIRALSFSLFPAHLAQMSLALAIEFTAEQVPGPSQDALVIVESVDPAGKAFVPTARVTPRPRLLSPGGDVSSFESVINWTNIVFERPGSYEFRVSYRDQDLTRIPLIIRGGPSTALPTERPWEAGLYQGLRAFSAGQLEEASKHFEQVTKEYPAVAEAWNNLGFLRLGEGSAKEAEECFDRARALGFANSATMSLNVGCARYIEGRYDSAIDAFADALKASRFEGPSILYVITRAGLRSVNVPDVQSFNGLGLLNMAWCEARLNHTSEASTVCKAAREAAVAAEGSILGWLDTSASQLEDLITETQAGTETG